MLRFRSHFDPLVLMRAHAQTHSRSHSLAPSPYPRMRRFTATQTHSYTHEPLHVQFGFRAATAGVASGHPQG
eukprot:7101300-Pyramimonas_sp.AAC.1